MAKTNTEVLTDNFSLWFLNPTFPFYVASHNISDSEPGCRSASPVECFQATHIIPKGVEFGEGVRKVARKASVWFRMPISFTLVEKLSRYSFPIHALGFLNIFSVISHTLLNVYSIIKI